MGQADLALFTPALRQAVLPFKHGTSGSGTFHARTQAGGAAIQTWDKRIWHFSRPHSGRRCCHSNMGQADLALFTPALRQAVLPFKRWTSGSGTFHARTQAGGAAIQTLDK